MATVKEGFRIQRRDIALDICETKDDELFPLSISSPSSLFKVYKTDEVKRGRRKASISNKRYRKKNTLAENTTKYLLNPQHKEPITTFSHSHLLNVPAKEKESSILGFRTSHFNVRHRLALDQQSNSLCLDYVRGTDDGPPSRADTLSHSTRLLQEDDEGDVEYKWRLTGVTTERFEHLVTQMQFRVFEGNGQCLYELGVNDDGVLRGLPEAEFEESVKTIERMAAALSFDCLLLKRCVVRTHPEYLFCGELLVSRRYAAGQDLSVVFCGAVNCGKSTLMGVLLSATLDDGDGSTRQLLFNHKHEIDTGRTTSISTRIWHLREGDDIDEETLGQGLLSIGNDGFCDPLQLPRRSSRESLAMPLAAGVTRGSSPERGDSYQRANQSEKQQQRFILMMDVGGDIAKSMLFAIMSRKPDYVCLCVASNEPAHYLGLYAQTCAAMGTPFLLVVTKCDAVDEFELYTYCMDLTATLEGLGYMCNLIDSKEEALEYCINWLPMQSHDATAGDDPTDLDPSPPLKPIRVPLFTVSSVTGKGLKLFQYCVSHLRSVRHRPSQSPATSPVSQPLFEVLLDRAFQVKDVGPVLQGRVSRGRVVVGCSCCIGPDASGAFHPVFVWDIHIERTHVNEAHPGDEATFAVDHLPEQVEISHKGKVLVGKPENVCDTFLLSVQLLSQSFTPNLQPIFYSRNARQAVRIRSYRSTLSNGRSATTMGSNETEYEVECEFMYRPEVLTIGSPCVLQWMPNGIAVGKVCFLGSHKMYASIGN
ncbi:unnamed protein product [Phytomonas sp. EM1]|nr:unnamed protein product [Phytomonas sp. EM1]|eukprot:CCW60646.1 unnamed protein product [Phytomonas sp. isolate EM1]